MDNSVLSHKVFIEVEGNAQSRNTRLLILCILAPFYVLPHTPMCSFVGCECTRPSRASPQSTWLSKQQKTVAVTLEPPKQPTEGSGLQIAESPLERGASLGFQ